RLQGTPALVTRASTGTFMLAGILHPRVLVARRVLQTLTPQQLAVALRHEEAHRASRDNLKRLLLILCPGLLPFAGGFRKLECQWLRLTEWAADDHAVNGDPRRSLTLAEALIRVARLNPMICSAPIFHGLLDEDFEARLARLLHPSPEVKEQPASRGF